MLTEASFEGAGGRPHPSLKEEEKNEKKRKNTEKKRKKERKKERRGL